MTSTGLSTGVIPRSVRLLKNFPGTVCLEGSCGRYRATESAEDGFKKYSMTDSLS